MLANAIRKAAARTAGHLNWWLWGSLLIISIAELLTATASPQLGLAIHALLLIVLTLYATAEQTGPERNLLLALTLAPLIRILSLSLPLLRLPWLAWYPAVVVPLLVATAIIIRILRLTPRQLGLDSGRVGIQLMLAGLGLGLGVIEYAILAPAPLAEGLAWDTFLATTVHLVLFTGFAEELIFRGVLLCLALVAMGGWGVLYVSLLFAAMHIGYLSLADLAFVFGVGTLFALVARWTGSILGVTLAHGLTNVTLFLVMPALAQQAAGPPLQAVLVLLGGTGVGLLGLALIARPHVMPLLRLATPLVETYARQWSAQVSSLPQQLERLRLSLPAILAAARSITSPAAAIADREAAPAETGVHAPTSDQPAAKAIPAMGQLVTNMLEPFLRVADPRSVRGRRYPLPAILAVTVCARLSGVPSTHATARWVFGKPRLWARLSPRATHPPSAGTFYRVLGRLDPTALDEALREWARLNLDGCSQALAVERKVTRGESTLWLPTTVPPADCAARVGELIDTYVQALDGPGTTEPEPGPARAEDPTEDR